MSKRENKRIRQLERRLAVLEKQQTTGCACRSKQEVTVEPKVQAKPKTIREKIEYKGMKDVKVGFPIIDDVAMKVASLYGMIQPGESQTAAVRAVFFVDPKGVLRAMIYYPLALGRNFDEIKRVLVGLQAIDAFGVAMPADWRPGDEVIVPMKGEDMNDQPEGVKCYDWFFCTRPLPKEEIEKKLGKGYEIKG